jgi:hypothetical protein
MHFHLGNGNHLMGSLQSASAAYNPMVGAGAQYAHPYSSAHHSSPSMHSLPSSHAAAAAAHMHVVHHQAQQQQNLSMHQNASMMSTSNGPVILVSNLNENVSRDI